MPSLLFQSPGVVIASEGHGLLSNNTFVRVNSNGMLDELQCVSGSRRANVGQWIAPNGQDITYSNTDPFDIAVGGVDNPGSLAIRQAIGQILTSAFQGVYTCVIPDESGVNRSIHVGIYSNGFSGKRQCGGGGGGGGGGGCKCVYIVLYPLSLHLSVKTNDKELSYVTYCTFVFCCSLDVISVISLDKSVNLANIFTMNCTTSGSPATSVTWRRNDIVLSTGSTYQTTQVLLDRSTAAYTNLLHVNAGPYGIPANYTCVASNLLGSATETTRFTG